ncbi:YhiI [Methylobacterium phyllosphaerae]|uniref:HlyD family secretion protein n=1 Tax=Methylobacterium phyllosphaerae TaxID=418223 RepID=A0AAE8HWC9_9HYPH|nr:HlyD family efflux transporter periplasmic adaptor subunit [Methylobacterium phyllosphaerae]APT32837.1 YhiI [Methylobacterium phyllosphaerae]SFH48936.1 HlyD family secretion protein [Methylobacterium phyllosphaerae]
MSVDTVLPSVSARNRTAEVLRDKVVPAPGAGVPSPAPCPPAGPDRRSRGLWLTAAIVLLLLAGGGYGWWKAHRPLLPPGFASGNGRLEANVIDIETKFAGRIARLLVEEGDLVRAGQVVAVMDTRDLEAQLSQAEAQIRQAQKGVEEAERTLVQQQAQVLATQAAVSQAERAVAEARANIQERQSHVKLTQQELSRSTYLTARGYASAEQLDTRRQAADEAAAALSAAEARFGGGEHALEVARKNADAAQAAREAAAARVGAARHALEAQTQSAAFIRVNIADNSLVAPRDGPIEYRVANVGEVLGAGGKVFTMLDAADVRMDVYLPTPEAGRVRIGAEARIVLDAYPRHVIPARVVFVSSQAQFTPKTVETRDERDKLMFRIRVRIDPERLRGRERLIRSGLPGIAYVRTDETAAWPASLLPSPPPAAPAPAPIPTAP